MMIFLDSFRFQIVAYFTLVPGVALIPLQIAKKLSIMKFESVNLCTHFHNRKTIFVSKTISMLSSSSI